MSNSYDEDMSGKENKFSDDVKDVIGLIIIFIILFYLSGCKTEYIIYNITDQKNGYEVGITCSNNGDPTVVGNFNGMLIISCGK